MTLQNVVIQLTCTLLYMSILFFVTINYFYSYISVNNSRCSWRINQFEFFFFLTKIKMCLYFLIFSLAIFILDYLV